MEDFVRFTTKPEKHILYIFCSSFNYYMDYSCFLSFTNNLTYKGKYSRKSGRVGKLLTVAVQTTIIVHVAVRGIIVRVHVTIRVGVSVQPRNVAVEVGRASPSLKQNNPI